MKKFLALLLAAVMVIFAFAACGNTKTPDSTDPSADKKAVDYDAISDTCESADGKYELAFVTDVGQLKDKSFNQGTWEGLKKFASDNGKTYKYYQPANGNKATDDDRFDAMKAAADSGAKVVVCAGFLQGTALQKAAETYPDVNFVFIDGWALQNASGEALKNVAGVDFQEEQSGYLAGYAAVKEGFTKLGFSGGGGGENPACCRFGYGYVQGAEAAAKELGKTVEMKYSWENGSSFSASPELQTMLNGWYTSGTEVVFSCGGSMCQSAFAAASANDGYVIGVDVDQSSQSSTVITSATKGIREAVAFTLQKYYDNKWSDIGGVQTTLGAANDAVGLPTDTWSLKNFSLEDYNKLFNSLKDGSVTVDKQYENLKADSFTAVKLEIV
ncbi:MAG: BMP family protein [Acutalibacteraceae bacterium]|nr:BMP family ABC transporter substrate-binding protein [Oscillospiraceae bacterium]